jgi:hypothetical protein
MLRHFYASIRNGDSGNDEEIRIGKARPERVLIFPIGKLRAQRVFILGINIRC